MNIITKFLSIVLSILCRVDGDKILVYSPSLSKSHVISNGRLADTLAAAGHDVTLFIPEYSADAKDFNPTTKSKIFRVNNISRIYDDGMAQAFQEIEGTSTLDLRGRLKFETIFGQMCDALLAKKDEFIHLKDEGFELGFTEEVELCGIGILKLLGINNFIWISALPLSDSVTYNLGIPTPRSYVPSVEENPLSDKMSFMDRLMNIQKSTEALIAHLYASWLITNAFRFRISPEFPWCGEIARNASFIFVFTDEYLDMARPISSKIVYVGGLGMHIKPKPLDEKFTRLMTLGSEGVILFSLGSIAPFHSLTPQIQTAIRNVIQKLSQYHFILKIDKEDNVSSELFNGVKNVELVEWMPQIDILAHPRLKLFVTHAGISGVLEAARMSIPLLLIPIFADQYRNAKNVERKGLGITLLRDDFTEERFENNLREILNNPSYKRNTERISRLILTKPFSAEEKVVKYTEFLLANGPISELLQLEAVNLNFVQLNNIDIYLLVTIIFAISIYLCLKFIRLFMWLLLFAKNGQIKTTKKE